MKILILLFLLLLSGCSQNIQIEYELSADDKIYAYNLKYQKLEEIYIGYDIKDYNDTFNLCTKYQNCLPIEYSFMSYPFIILYDSYVKDNNVYYIVDQNINLSEDIGIFSSILNKINSDLGYDRTIIIIKN